MTFTAIFWSRRHYKYDRLESAWIWLAAVTISHKSDSSDSDLTKYDWRRRLGDGGSGDYLYATEALRCGDLLRQERC